MIDPAMHKVVTTAEEPALVEAIQGLHRDAWPEFLGHDAGVNRHWRALYAAFGEFQFAIRDGGGTIVAAGNTIPIAWNGTRGDLPPSIAAVLERGLQGREHDRPATTLTALAALVAPGQRGRGLSRLVVETMRALAARRGLGALIAPVRPTDKHRYPLARMERYVAWTRADGSPLDPWLRVHFRLGAELLDIAPQAMVVEASVAEWEAWTSLAFPETGAYVVPGALQPVAIDRERDRGRYEDPNVWMRHAVPA